MVPPLIVSKMIVITYCIAFCGGNCHCGGCHIKMAQIITDVIPRPTDKEKETLKKCVDVDERYVRV